MTNGDKRTKWLNKVKKDGMELENADETIRADKEIVIAAVKNYAYALEHADTTLKKDKEVLMVAELCAVTSGRLSGCADCAGQIPSIGAPHGRPTGRQMLPAQPH